MTASGLTSEERESLVLKLMMFKGNERKNTYKRERERVRERERERDRERERERERHTHTPLVLWLQSRLMCYLPNIHIAISVIYFHEWNYAHMTKEAMVNCSHLYSEHSIHILAVGWGTHKYKYWRIENECVCVHWADLVNQWNNKTTCCYLETTI